MMSIADFNRAYIIEAFNTTSRYLDDILSINIIYFYNMEKSDMPFREFRCNKTNTSDT